MNDNNRIIILAVVAVVSVCCLCICCVALFGGIYSSGLLDSTPGANAPSSRAVKTPRGATLTPASPGARRVGGTLVPTATPTTAGAPAAPASAPEAPTVTPTTAGAPEAPAAPASGALTPEEQAYGASFENQNQRWTDSRQKVDALLAAPNPADPNWKKDILVQLVSWRNIAGQARGLTVPTRFQNVHKTYLEAVQHFDTAAGLGIDGVVKQDSATFERAKTEMSAGDGVLNDARTQMAALKG